MRSFPDFPFTHPHPRMPLIKNSTLVWLFFLASLAGGLSSCQTFRRIPWPERQSALGGTAFYQAAAGMNWSSRDSFALAQWRAGNIPARYKAFQKIRVSGMDTLSGKLLRAVYFAAPDYVSIGPDSDWARVPLTPMTGQKIADRLQCFLPTRKMVNDLYQAAKVKLAPVPMYAFRDSTPTLWHHHLIIEGQRQGKKGLIAGIKKDVVLSNKVTDDPRPNRVAIYGWHRLNGQPIQPLYGGHVNWYVDYSHGIRLIWRRIKVHANGKTQWMDYQEVLRDPVLSRLLCDEPECSFFAYP